jgi:DNA-binding MltR family transcriptional regulator
MQMFGHRSESSRIHDDRGAAILITNYLDFALMAAIAHKLKIDGKEYMDVLFDEHCPLYTFDAKIKMGYALLLYGKKTYKQLARIKNIRNTFAHAYQEITFETTEVTMECEALEIYEPLSMVSTSAFDTPREKFLEICDATALILINQMAPAVDERPREEDEAFITTPLP